MAENYGVLFHCKEKEFAPMTITVNSRDGLRLLDAVAHFAHQTATADSPVRQMAKSIINACDECAAINGFTIPVFPQQS